MQIPGCDTDQDQDYRRGANLDHHNDEGLLKGFQEDRNHRTSVA